MRHIEIDFSGKVPRITDKYAGEKGEHQAVTLDVIPEAAMSSDEDLAFYYLLFKVEGGLVASRTFNQGEDISVALWGQLTENRNVVFQLIGTNGLETIIAKSPIITLYLGESLDGTVIGIDDNRDSLIAMIGAFNERLTEDERTIADLVDTGIGILDFSVVQALPQQGEPNVVYLVSAGEGTCDEYMWVSGAWLKIGSTDIDLSGYAKKDELFEPYVLDWSDAGASTSYSLGWRSGYWKDDGTLGTNVKYISSTRIRAYASDSSYSHDFNGIKKFKVSLPPDVSSIVVKEWVEGSQSSTLTNRWDLVEGDELELNPGRMYAFNIGYESDASDKLTAAYLAQIKLTLFPYAPHKKKSTEFERFAVKVNLAWPDVYSTSSDNAEPVNEANIRCVISLPDNYTEAGKPVPAIMISHGSGSSVQYNKWNDNNASFLEMVRAFTAAGYAVFDVDNTRGNANGFRDYGCLPLCTAYIKAWEKIKRFYNVQPGLFIYSLSMGTTAALNLLKWHQTDIKAAVNSAPRPLCETVYRNASAGSTIRTQMSQAFGLSGPSWEHDRLVGFNHYENLVTIGEKKYLFEKFPPVKVLVGGEDDSYTEEIDDYYTGLSNTGNYISKRTVDGATHDDMCFLVPGSLREEVINWFNRFKD